MKPEISAALTLLEFDCDPEKITKNLGIKPSKTWKKGDQIGKSRLHHKQNGWSLKSKLESSVPLDEQIKSVYEELKPVWSNLIRLCSEYYSEIECVIYSYEAQGPSIHLDKEIIKRAAEIGAEIDIDYYCLCESKEDP